MKSPRTKEKQPSAQFNPRQSKAADAQARDEKVRQRAYELFEARMRAGSPGSDVTDWLQAEHDVATA
ncbi:MAG TPA: DUF2934 domain-containing protein [Phycisphaerae bacterium]|nr:DUF2934 domain-containing protein [Phycisphaerales bacterium]HRX86394.1 DUF2934 domain-containing protein [Phycisphaerae bacterium]